MALFQEGIPTIHNEAKKEDIAKTVLMPGDPMRAKYFAEQHLQDALCFNEVRGMLGYTGKYKGHRVSIMGSGMGAPSIGIYSYELYKFYDVENIIRIGTCGAGNEDMEIMDVILADKAYSQSNYALMQAGYTESDMPASKYINEKAIEAAKELNQKLTVGPVCSGDTFYSQVRDQHTKFDAKGVEMEAFALFCNAKQLGKNAACLVTVTDSKFKGTLIPSEEREKRVGEMVLLALETAIKLG